MAPSKQHYKIRLASGRVLGPLDIERVAALINKNKIVGTEDAREHPQGDWKNINQIPKLADLLLEKFQSSLSLKQNPQDALPSKPLQNEHEKAARQITSDETKLLNGVALPGAKSKGINLREILPTTIMVPPPANPEIPKAESPPPEEPKTLVTTAKAGAEVPPGDTFEIKLISNDDNDKTVVSRPSGGALNSGNSDKPDNSDGLELFQDFHIDKPKISEQPTVIFQTNFGSTKKKSKTTNVKRLAFLVLMFIFADEFLFPNEDAPSVPELIQIRPYLPTAIPGKADPELSEKKYHETIKNYFADNVVGYRRSVNTLQLAASYDKENVKALALLASSYLNLIDSSNKDENYFNVISRLIEMSRSKNMDLPETVIADVEFYLTINKAEAAENRIVEYSRTHQGTFGLELFYYLAMSFFARGDFQNSATYVASIPENKIFSPKVYYLRGQLAEKFGQTEQAIKEYQKAVKLSPEHAKSRLRLAEIMQKNGNVKQSAGQLDFIINHADLLAPKDLAQAYYLRSNYNGYSKNWDVALGDIERAVKLVPDNHRYLLQHYALRAEAGDTVPNIKNQAKMYYYLGEGEKLVQQGQYHEALVWFLKAREVNDNAFLPLVKIGDMFVYLHDLGNALMNYKVATKKAPNNIEVWSKYINVLIQSYEWEEAALAMDRFRKLPVNQSSIDKAAADMYAKQGQQVEAQAFYRKAMTRETIDPSVYIAYANSLVATKRYKDASFFFALSLRFDPLNIDALLGTAECIAATDSLDRAIRMLQDELQKSIAIRVELLTAIANFQIRKGDWDRATENITQAMSINPDYALPWKLLAQLYMTKENTRGMVEKALDAYQSYSERNPSDPSGYLERYRIFIKKMKYQEAGDEIEKVFILYPKYPNIHYYKGLLYGYKGNHAQAIQEFRTEIKNNPNNVQAHLELGKKWLDVAQDNKERIQDALEQFTTAMKLAPQSAEAKQQTAYTNYLLKNYSAAVALYRAALAFDNANPIIYKRLGLALREMGDSQGAADAFRKYLQMEPDAPDKLEFQPYL